LKLSVVVPTRNRRDVLILRTLPAMFDQQIPADEAEIIVVVDGATDGTALALRELKSPFSLGIIEQSNRGPSAARNAGIRSARGDVVLFIDDDILCGPDLFRKHIEAHAGQVRSVVYGRLSIAPESPPSVLKFANEAWYEQYYARIESQNGLKLPQNDYLISNSSIPRATLLECGGFDETMTAKEDYELALRLWKMGLRFIYQPDARAFEYFQKPVQYVLRNDGKAFGETDILLSRKHPEYRPYSAQAGVGKIAWLKILYRRIFAALPFDPVGVLNFPLSICDRLCRFQIMRRVSRHLLGAGRSVVEFRSALRQIGSWQNLKREFGMRLPVLLYHHVGPERPGTMLGLTVSAETFERHVRRLAHRGYVGICPTDWLRWRQEGKGLPEKPVLITFDDGYEDLVEYALPVLRRYGFGGAVYVVTKQLGGSNAWDEARGWGTLRLMTAEQIIFWASHGIEFGAHSRNHADLTSLTEEELTEEVVGSRRDLELLLGSRVASFAYPYGFRNQRVENSVRDAFDLAFIADDADEGLNYLQTDPHLLLRTMVQSDDSLFAIECRARWGRYPFLGWWDRLRVRVALRTRLKRGVAAFVARIRNSVRPDQTS
jgi:glycosyltransferase involved in cell wall biosynthesis/peptidoglycan/xylan/chitin deacetylase (PgdA/CDA1 family)